MDFLKINGAYGEGGGQIIRSAIALSCITHQPIHLENIRNNRKIPGLQPQHLSTIKILQKITNAKTTGNEIGSTELKFSPGEIKNLKIIEDVGTAGSISLILQILIPVIAISQKKLSLTIVGGTDVLWSPSMDYTCYVLKEAYSRMGIKFVVKLDKRGYYPKGRGQVRLEVYPSKINSVKFTKQKTKDVELVCTFSKIPIDEIKEDVMKIVAKLTKKNFVVNTEIKKEDASDSGGSLLVYSIDQNSIIGVDSIFNKKKRSFNFDYEKFSENKLGIDENLADMLVVPASIANGKTIFHVQKLTKHLETNLFVTSKITGCRYGIGKLGNGFEVIIEGVSYSGIK